MQKRADAARAEIGDVAHEPVDVDEAGVAVLVAHALVPATERQAGHRRDLQRLGLVWLRADLGGQLDAGFGGAERLGEALGDKKGIRRFGQCSIPMDETLAEAVVDVSGRPYCVHTGEPESMVGYVVPAGAHADGRPGTPYGTVLNRHVFETLAFQARIALHVRVHYGRDPHHITEAEFKAVARALRAAVEDDPRVEGIPSTKGAL